MSDESPKPDVKQLAEEDFPRSEFPAGRRQDFRVHLAEDVHQRIVEHAGENLSVEIGGVLVGRWERDDDGPFAVVSEMIRCDSAASKTAEVTFTHDTWTAINNEMDNQFTELSIVGWYHSHPDFGIFLSDRDAFIQEHFFSGSGQVAYVVDPVRKTEGIFVWRKGKPTPCPHYWIGERIVAPSQSSPSQAKPDPASSAAAPGAAPSAAEIDWLRLLGIAVPLVAMLLVGYLLGSLRSDWERVRISEGAVAHYGVWKGLRPGLGENLDQVNENLAKIETVLGTLSTQHVELAGDDSDETKAAWSEVAKGLRSTRDFLGKIKGRYSLTSGEAAVVARIIADKMAELQGEKPTEDAAGEPSGKSGKPDAESGAPTGKSDTPAGKPAASGGQSNEAAGKPNPTEGTGAKASPKKEAKTELPGTPQPRQTGETQSEKPSPVEKVNPTDVTPK